MKIQYIDRSTGELHTESPPAEGLLKFLYDNPFGRSAILPLAKRKFISAWYGRRMDKASSVRRIQPFVDSLQIDMSESQKSIDAFTSFNDFFYRELKNGARPISNGLVSPGDGRLLAFERVADVHEFFIKGQRFTLADFFKSKEFAERFQSYSMYILRLAPSDYHRFHFPAAGIPSPLTLIKGSYFSVSPYALASNFTRVFTENKRAYCVHNSDEFGEIVLAPIGATMVGSIISTYTPDMSLAKGDEMGYFAFGGSTIVVLVDPQAVTIDGDLIEHTKNKIETYVRMGEQIGA